MFSTSVEASPMEHDQFATELVKDHLTGIDITIENQVMACASVDFSFCVTTFISNAETPLTKIDPSVEIYQKLKLFTSHQMKDNCDTDINSNFFIDFDELSERKWFKYKCRFSQIHRPF
jgi:hypothetical protein